MKSNLEINAGPETNVSRPTPNDRNRTSRKKTWLIGITILWAIIVFGAQRLLSTESYTAVARIEILGSRDRFDPRVWFQDKFPAIASPNINEYAEAFKSRDLAQSVVAALKPQEFEELRPALTQKESRPERILAKIMSLLPDNENAIAKILGPTARRQLHLCTGDNYTCAC